VTVEARHLNDTAGFIAHLTGRLKIGGAAQNSLP
jgi:hypothetical protein